MKKITLVLMTFLFVGQAWGQCVIDNAFGTLALANDGTIEVIAGNSWTGEHSEVTGFVDGNEYVIFCELAADGTPKFVTISELGNDANVLAFGQTPFTFTATSIPDLKLSWTDDAGPTCGTTNASHITAVQNLTVAADACPDPVGFGVDAVTEMTADLSWFEQGISAVSYNVEVYAAGQSAGNGDTPVFADPAVVGLSVTATGLMESTDYDAYITTACSGATTNSMLVGPVAFTTAASCGDVTGLGTDNLTSDAVDVIFTPGNNNDVFLVEVYLSGQSASNGDTPVFSDAAVTASPVNVSGLTPETDYDIFVTGSCGATATALQGPETFTTPAAPPANDDFANAAPVVCGGNYVGSTTNATLDEDDAPDSSSPNVDLDAPNVWYSYTGSGTPEDVTLNLCPSNYDTSVLVYTGTSGNLTLVAANDDGGTTNCPGAGTRSFLTFQSDGTTTYYITVEGWNVGSVGDYDMTVTCVAQTPPPANDLCSNAEMLVLAQTVEGTTVGATGEIGDDNPSCESQFATIVDVWYSVEITGGVSDLTITTVITGTSDQANVVVYEDCTLATELGCSDANGGESLTIPGLDPGTYIVRVWGDGVAARIEGTFDITADAVLSNGQDFNNPAGFTYFPNPVSNTLTLNAAFNNIEDVTIFNMLGQSVLNSKPNALNSEVDMSNLQTGTYFVQVTVANETQTIRVVKQ